MYSKISSFIGELLQIVVFAISIFLFVYLLVLQPHKIKGESMEPNFHNSEYLLTDKVSYRFGDPERGDVIVFKAPPSYTDEFIKRVIAIPGETVMVKDGHVYVNGNQINEDYIPNNFVTRPGQYAQEGVEITVGENEYFVLGDNRDHSLDSRVLGTIGKEYITGRAWLVYWPINQIGVITAPIYAF